MGLPRAAARADLARNQDPLCADHRRRGLGDSAADANDSRVKPTRRALDEAAGRRHPLSAVRLQRSRSVDLPDARHDEIERIAAWDRASFEGLFSASPPAACIRGRRADRSLRLRIDSRRADLLLRRDGGLGHAGDSGLSPAHRVRRFWNQRVVIDTQLLQSRCGPRAAICDATAVLRDSGRVSDKPRSSGLASAVQLESFYWRY